jgi:site-specific recombinase XerD
VKVRVTFPGQVPHLCGTDDAAANAFLEAVAARGLTPATLRAYAFDLVVIYRWLATVDLCVAKLKPANLMAFVADQQQRGAKPASINRRLTTFELLYRFITGVHIGAGPGCTTPAPHYRGRGRDRALGLHQLPRQRHLKLRVKTPHKLVEPLTRQQVRAFVRSLHRYRDLALVHLLLFCGLRASELRALKLTDVDFDEGVVRIHGKGNRERVLPLPPSLRPLISKYLRLERPTTTTTDHLFVVLQGPRRGQPMTAAGLRSFFRHRRARHDDLRPAHAHRFRHTFGADMARAGVRLALLQRMMGHASAHTTLQYINLSMADIAEEYHRAVQSIESRYQDDDEP